jgi:hypothetical protein
MRFLAKTNRELRLPVMVVSAVGGLRLDIAMPSLTECHGIAP